MFLLYLHFISPIEIVSYKNIEKIRIEQGHREKVARFDGWH